MRRVHQLVDKIEGDEEKSAVPNFLAIKIRNNFSYLNAKDSRVVVLVKDFSTWN